MPQAPSLQPAARPLKPATCNLQPETRPGLPPLVGTPAEVAFAEQVRERIFASVRRAQREARRPAVAQEYAAIKEFLHEQTSARFWIEKRHLKPSQLNRLRYAAAAAACRALLEPLRAAKAARAAAGDNTFAA